MLAVYVSGHGYGHATRTAEVLRELRARAPGLKIVVTSRAPAFLFEGTVDPPLELRALATDVGLAQRDALVIDEPGTVAAWRDFMRGWDERVAAEAGWLRDSRARLVLGDIPPLAFEAAARAALPAIALGNFSWDWIYAHLARHEPALAQAASWAREAYRSAALLLRLPFAGDLSAFPCVEDVPLVARKPGVARHEARRRLGLDERPAVLFSFGGVGIRGLRTSASRELRRFQVVDESLRVRAGLGYPDLVGAADVVVTKPGYGIVSDCIGARTRLVYTDRGDFPEYPIMVAEMGRFVPAVHVPSEALREGRIEAALDRALSLPFPEPPPLDGAAVAAARILERT